jgi:hypothetical protein
MNGFDLKAGTALGTSYGVAKEAYLNYIEALANGGSTASIVIAGFKHVAVLKKALSMPSMLWMLVLETHLLKLSTRLFLILWQLTLWLLFRLGMAGTLTLVSEVLHQSLWPLLYDLRTDMIWSRTFPFMEHVWI